MFLGRPLLGPGAVHHFVQHGIGRAHQPFHDLRGQERQPHAPAHLCHVHAFGLGDLGHQCRPLLIQQALSVVRQSERPHQRGVLRGRPGFPLPGGLGQEFLWSVQGRDDLLLQLSLH